MIEVLNGVFYDPDKEWYLQPQELIDLGLEVETTQPYDFEIESNDTNTRYTLLKWFHVTEMGTFEFQVAMSYLYGISSKNFLTKLKHNKVTLLKISNEQL